MTQRNLLSIDSGDILFCQSHQSLETGLYHEFLA